MRRSIRTAIAIAAIIGGTAYIAGSADATRIVPHAASCGNTYPADGHVGPWRTTNNGGTLHGNTVHIDCPSPDTHWDVVYRVQGAIGGVWVNVFSVHRSGNGSPNDWSVNTSPFDCDTVNVYRTHVDNTVTGGTINKPGGGGGVHLACG